LVAGLPVRRDDVSRGLSMGLIALALALGGCSGATGGTPTLSADDVIRTAEAMAEATRHVVTATPSQAPATPTATVEVLVSPTVAATATPAVEGPTATASYPVKVRSGPGEEYGEIDLFLTGQMARVVGRYDDTPIGTWYLLQRIDVGKDGWVWSGAVTLAGDAAMIPIVTPSD
jgi:hypothetical protein